MALTMSRPESRRAFAALLALAVLGRAGLAGAGSYLDRASFLIGQATKENEFLRKRLYDRELARLVSQVARGRLESAKQTLVPKEVVLAHPHLLLMLEHYERAASAAAEGELARYFELERAARDEEQIFRGILRQLGWSLPSGKG
jgi:hypothetical protein